VAWVLAGSYHVVIANVDAAHLANNPHLHTAVRMLASCAWIQYTELCALCTCIYLSVYACVSDMHAVAFHLSNLSHVNLCHLLLLSQLDCSANARALHTSASDKGNTTQFL
jgi:hypothetical protein